jgi:hypothetical protein
LNDLLRLGPVALSHVPMGWMVGRTLLAVLLLAALAVERFIPTARQPSRETAGALFVVAVAAYVTSAAFIAAPATPVVKAGALFSRPWETLPGILFVLAAIFFYRRYQQGKKSDSDASLYDYSLFLVALLNVCCHIAALFSRRLFDGPFFRSGSHAGGKRSTHRAGELPSAARGDRIGIGPLPADAAPVQHCPDGHGRPEKHQRPLRASGGQPFPGPARQDFAESLTSD